jgi:hypothetical protein
MIAQFTSNNFRIMRSNNLKQLNKYEYLHWSKVLLLSQFFNDLQGTDITDLRLEGA